LDYMHGRMNYKDTKPYMYWPDHGRESTLVSLLQLSVLSVHRQRYVNSTADHTVMFTFWLG
jgi:hypothetical protein